MKLGMTDNIRDNLTSVFLNFYHQSLIIVFVRANGLFLSQMNPIHSLVFFYL
jgi:hypothetical protein